MKADIFINNVGEKNNRNIHSVTLASIVTNLDKAQANLFGYNEKSSIKLVACAKDWASVINSLL